MKARVIVRLDWGLGGEWRARRRSFVKLSREEGVGAMCVGRVAIFSTFVVTMLNSK